MKNKKTEENSLIVFQDKKIRRIWHQDQWFFSVIDVVQALTDSADAKDYWYRLKKREQESSGIELSTFCRQLKLPSADGKSYATDCANTKSIFRIIQSIPSKKAEPFKLWLAKMGYERVQEIDPEDYGSYPGYYELMKIKKNKKHPEYKERIKEWLGEDFDFEHFDIEEINKELLKLVKVDGRTRYWVPK